MNKTLFIIPARSGSKGIPLKNIKPLNGKPLICYSIDAAREVADDSDICVSTDNSEFIQIVENYGLHVPFKRPDHLSTDQSSTEDVIKHAIEHYKEQGVNYETVVILQPTSPLRKGFHIKEALKCFSQNIDMVVGVKETRSNPYYVLFEENEKGYLEKSKKGAFTRRQDCPKVWEYNGAMYVINVASLMSKKLADFDKVVKYQMDEISSLDLDTPLDWKILEVVMNNNHT